MNRRRFLRGAAAAAGGAGAAVAGLELSSGDASAQAATALDVAGDDVLLDAGGAIAAVRLALTVDWSYDVPEGVQPETVVVEVAAGVDGASVVASAESAELFAEADGSESFDVELVEAGAVDPAALAPDSGSRTTEVTLEARVRVENGAGKAVATATATDTAPLTVDREDYSAAEYGEVGGSGSLTLEVE
jgi:hypothetical protein